MAIKSTRFWLDDGKTYPVSDRRVVFPMGMGSAMTRTPETPHLGGRIIYPFLIGWWKNLSCVWLEGRVSYGDGQRHDEEAGDAAAGRKNNLPVSDWTME
jgi:hypothetical protein